MLQSLVLALLAVTWASATPIDIVYDLSPERPFHSTQRVGPNNDVTFRFTFNESYTPRFATSLVKGSLQTNRSSAVSYLVADACYANSLFLPASRDEDECGSTQAERSICQKACDFPGDFAIAVSSFAPQNITLNVTLEDINLLLAQPRKIKLRSWSPVFLRFDFGTLQRVHFRLRSETQEEVIVSIQNETCPLFDMPSSVQYQGKHMTMSTQGDIYADLEDGQHGVYVVVVFKPGQGCSLTKEITITAIETLPIDQYYIKVLIMMSWFLGPSLAFFTLFIIEKYRKHGFAMNEPELQEPSSPREVQVNEDHDADYLVLEAPETRPAVPPDVKYGWDTGTYDPRSKYYYRSKIELRVSDLTRKPASVYIRKFRGYIMTLVAVGVFYALPVAQLVIGYLKLFLDGQEDVCYYNFACARKAGYLPQFNNIISNSGYVILGALFLFIVYRRTYVLHNDRRNRFRKKIGQEMIDELEGPTPETTRGLPRAHGIFYAAGIALICEGVFSACYHICPSFTNFQFDVAFMYMIAGLLTLALYQRRHSDAKAGPGSVFIMFAGLTLLNVLGVYWGSANFYIFVCCILLTSGFFLALQIYYLGQWTVDFGCPYFVKSADASVFKFEPELSAVTSTADENEPLVAAMHGNSSPRPRTQAPAHHDHTPLTRVPYLIIRPFRLLLLPYTCRCKQCQGLIDEPHSWRRLLPHRRARAIKVILLVALNAVFAIGGLISPLSDVSTYFLALLIANFIAYLVYYFIMKVFVMREKLSLLPKICLALAILFWGPALYFFNAGLTDWTVSPAESREGNADCLILDFFDAHDVWHMLSAAGLFFGCMSMLSLDDDLANVERSEIHVF
eukprot:m.36737 g.36737  ORF g.36737 m.36737 type:complete len:848 (-) comp9713_c0_seq1:26-2569(-)